LADTAIAITAGTGTNVDTRTEATNGNHRQVIVIGDPSTNAGVAPVDATKGLAVDLTASGALPTVTAVTTVSTVTNLAQMGGAALNMGAGATSTGTQRVALASDSPGIIATGTAGSASSTVLTVQGIASMTPLLSTVTNTALTNFGAGEYETVAASQTAQVLGATGGTGDYISGILVIPATTSPGNVLLLDNATSITVFTGGASSVSNLVPFFIPLGMISVSGAWKVTTGANVSCIGIGNFT
jgi:hypothetical protein